MTLPVGGHDTMMTHMSLAAMCTAPFLEADPLHGASSLTCNLCLSCRLWGRPGRLEDRGQHWPEGTLWLPEFMFLSAICTVAPLLTSYRGRMLGMRPVLVLQALEQTWRAGRPRATSVL